MMKYISTIYSLVLLIVLTSNSTAQTNWEKYYENPVLVPGPSGTWNDYGLSPFCIHFDGSIYHLWFGGVDGTNTRIGYATSGDGITWIEYGNNPIFDGGPSGSWDEGISGPYVLFDGSTYHMWYAGNDGTNTRIGYATSDDSITWIRYEGNPVMDKGQAGSWESVGVWPDCIYFDGSTYHMWYGGYDGTEIYSRIGYATSADGITWTKYDDPTTSGSLYSESDPVLLPDPGKWDQQGVGSPHVLFHGDEYHMWYTGSSSGSGWQWDIGYATSANGTTWTKHESNPVLTSDAGEWDSQYVGFSRVLWDSTTAKYNMWYAGGSENFNAKIGYATADTVTGIYNTLSIGLPDNFLMRQNYPNPFNPSTTIEFDLPKATDVKIEVYNIAGQKVQTLLNQKMSAGSHQVEFNAQNLSSGVYFYRIETGEFQDVKKMILLR